MLQALFVVVYLGVVVFLIVAWLRACGKSERLETTLLLQGIAITRADAMYDAIYSAIGTDDAGDPAFCDDAAGVVLDATESYNDFRSSLRHAESEVK